MILRKTCAFFFLVVLAPASCFVPAGMPSRMTMISRMSSDDDAQDQAQLLRDKAAAIRAEIAALEGKSVEQVQEEANAKKTAELRVQQELQEARQKQRDEKPRDWGRMLEVPVTRQDMVTQAARAVERAFRDGVTRQTVRFALVKEDQPFSEMELWPGGAQEMSREAAKPLTRELLSTLRLVPSEQLLPPQVKEQDVWDFDGSAIVSSEAQEGATFDVQALVLPNTDAKYIEDIDTMDQAMKERLFLLVNPFWRNLDSWGINILQPNAKKNAQRIIFDKGYDETYHFLRFSVRGEECAAIKAYPYDWQVFAYLEDPQTGWEQPIRLGSSEEYPKSELITEWLNGTPEFKMSRNMRQMNR